MAIKHIWRATVNTKLRVSSDRALKLKAIGEVVFDIDDASGAGAGVDEESSFNGLERAHKLLLLSGKSPDEVAKLLAAYRGAVK